MGDSYADILKEKYPAATKRHMTRRTAVGLAASALFSTLGVCLCACAAPSQGAAPDETDTPTLNPKDEASVVVAGTELSEEERARDQQNESGRPAALAQAAANAVPFGEEAVLTNGDRIAMGGTERADTKQHGDWIGSMGIRIERAEIYASLDEAQAARDLGRVTGVGEAGAEAEGLLYLVADVHVSNVDSVGPFSQNEAQYAAYTQGVDNPPAADYLFMSSEFKVVTTAPEGTYGGPDYASFAGGCGASGSNLDLDLWSFYELAPGEETTLTIGWWVYADTDPSTFYLTTDLTSSSSPYPEILFDLGLGQDAVSE